MEGGVGVSRESRVGMATVGSFTVSKGDCGGG